MTESKKIDLTVLLTLDRLPGGTTLKALVGALLDGTLDIDHDEPDEADMAEYKATLERGLAGSFARLTKADLVWEFGQSPDGTVFQITEKGRLRVALIRARGIVENME